MQDKQNWILIYSLWKYFTSCQINLINGRHPYQICNTTYWNYCILTIHIVLTWVRNNKRFSLYFWHPTNQSIYSYSVTSTFNQLGINKWHDLIGVTGQYKELLNGWTEIIILKLEWSSEIFCMRRPTRRKLDLTLG